ncbi:undecaprenyl-diphosphatase [Deinococcus metalli]|uniref:Undecaprenyl-diphosphatase n=1 Tax=Deinococcus metalli TaxID=1141878 RepID=A0A7W8KBD9_9DEIO|nr:undecaprenyl-diphosphate phosphatase [Deinococcus metalli]MBB5374996.1 undecaprenyl-diphosphatase [Deinococcus metalli]GHF32203.1 undecaprenyl-diphosphatase [Deinococcus metalli]
MDALYSIILGIVEGITEFLPISSTGHLIVAGDLLAGMTTTPWTKEMRAAFEVVIQGGAILSVLVYYWRDFLKIRTVGRDATQRRLWTSVVIGCIPAVILGVLFGSTIKHYLFTPSVVAWALIVGGVLIWLVESRRVTPTVHHIEQITPVKALGIGAVQCLALLWPGFSRSASSILGGMLLGLDRPAATQFSFYLGFLTLGGASLLDLIKSRAVLAQIGTLNMVLGIGVSFVVAYVSIGWLLRFVSTHDFKPFAVYRVIVGVLILVLIATGVLSNASLA